MQQDINLTCIFTIPNYQGGKWGAGGVNIFVNQQEIFTNSTIYCINVTKIYIYTLFSDPNFCQTIIIFRGKLDLREKGHILQMHCMCVLKLNQVLYLSAFIKQKSFQLCPENICSFNLFVHLICQCIPPPVCSSHIGTQQLFFNLI